MPLVRISMVTGRTYEERQVIGSCVHEALVEAIGIPADDLFQVVTEYGYEESATDEAPKLNMFWDPHYLGIERTSGILFVQVFLRSGRTVEQKQAFYQRTVELLAERAGVRPEDVMITLSENGPEDWSFGNGVAQYVK
jgi:phenylpyruvate tautomerase PptA (4-oxalocrotonate tautomerase family)